MKFSTLRRPFRDKAIGLFIDQVHRNRQCYWASDLVSNGLTSDEICRAIQRALDSCKRSGMDVDLHFQLKHFGSEECSSFNDCKLSRFGYLLTVINANPNNEYVAQFQKQVLEHHFLAINDLNIG